mmetsp:Transcript_7608/g.16729  ORF Transcript_7608/g.16729 Transcript_7608/m.16729 type:complete len:210 (+) Transcript_7608:574-1203(+)
MSRRTPPQPQLATGAWPRVWRAQRRTERARLREVTARARLWNRRDRCCAMLKTSSLRSSPPCSRAELERASAQRGLPPRRLRPYACQCALWRLEGSLLLKRFSARHGASLPAPVVDPAGEITGDYWCLFEVACWAPRASEDLPGRDGCCSLVQCVHVCALRFLSAAWPLREGCGRGPLRRGRVGPFITCGVHALRPFFLGVFCLRRRCT